MARTARSNGKTRSTAIEVTHRYCAARPPAAPKLPRGVSSERKRLILENTSKWANGTTISYWFFDAPAKWAAPKAQMDVVRDAFQLWKKLGIGLNFQEVNDRKLAQVRIGFLKDDGAWSYVGKDVMTKRADPRTMNFGWSLTGSDGLDTALHEIGHTLGFPHEHQNPFAGIVWDEEAVYAALAKPPNKWGRSTTYSNIIEKIVADSVQGSEWDPNSVMHYPFEPGLIRKPAEYRTAGITPAGGLSARDKAWVQKFYPATNGAQTRKLLPFQSVPLALAPSQQATFVFTPPTSRNYELRTFGTADTVMSIFADADAVKPIAEDDDSGEARNAYLKIPMQANRDYLVRVRLYYKQEQAETAVMAW